ncbi:MAG: CYTH domain-containing protein, partial [Verrucomicrobiaceae bacterium]
WRDGSPGTRLSQGYLTRDSGRTVRVRTSGEKAWLTIKGNSEGIRRSEFEYEIPVEEGRELLGLCLPSVIDKTRYEVHFAGHLWEIDVFHGDNDGLIVAEVEIEDESVKPELPPWIGKEVSGEDRYYNSSLAVRPYAIW